MCFEPVNPMQDARVRHCHAILNGRRYYYLLAEPSEGYRHTIFLIHGWPDLSIGWRYQIPTLLGMRFRVVCPDVMGYGETDAPSVPPAESLGFYSFKRCADDIKELAKQLGSSRIIVGGHDWGGAAVYRIALWHPDLVSHVFAVCTPYNPPSKQYMDLEEMVKTKLPNFAYQIQLAGGEVESRIQTKEQIKQFLNAAYGSRTPSGDRGFDPARGILFKNLPKLKQTRVMSPEMLQYYTDQYSINGVHGPLNWYRTRKQNFQEELKLERSNIEVPVLFIQANKDIALPPAMSVGMERWIPNLTRRSVEASHWALWEAPGAVNTLIEEWLNEAVKIPSNL